MDSPLPSTGRNRRGKGIGEEPFFTIRGGVKTRSFQSPAHPMEARPPQSASKISRQAEQLAREASRCPDWSEPSPGKRRQTRGPCEWRDACLIWIFSSQALVPGRSKPWPLHHAVHRPTSSSPYSNRFPGEPLSINLDVIHRNGRFQLPEWNDWLLLPPTEPEAPWPGTRTEARDHYQPNGPSSGRSCFHDPEDWIASQVARPNGRSRWMGWCFPGGP